MGVGAAEGFDCYGFKGDVWATVGLLQQGLKMMEDCLVWMENWSKCLPMDWFFSGTFTPDNEA